MIEIDGLKIFGSPYTQKYGKGAFQYSKSDDHLAWNYLPEKIDVLITHGPPYGILDQTHKGDHVGSVGLMKAVQRIRPRLHIFGHIHEGHGKREKSGIIFMNVAKKY